MTFDHYDNPQHQRSAAIAAKEVAGRMIAHKSALNVPAECIKAAKQLLYACLERIGSLLSHGQQDTFYGIAVEFVPLGTVSAEALFPPADAPFVLVDTGVIEFLGQMSTLCTTLRAQARGEIDEFLTEQDIIDSIWTAGLIYHDKLNEWEPRGEAWITPKIGDSHLPQIFQYQAHDMALAGQLFLVCHEIAHIICKEWPSTLELLDFPLCSNLESIFQENRADNLACWLMVNYAIRWPHVQKKVNLISGVDFCLTCFEVMQSAFPVCHDESLKIVVNCESLDHPLAGCRRENFRENLFDYFPSGYIERKEDADLYIGYGRSIERLLAPFERVIRNGALPSQNFQVVREIAKHIYDQ